MPYHIFENDIKYARYGALFAFILFGLTLIIWFYDGFSSFTLFMSCAGALLSAISMKQTVNIIRKRKEHFEKAIEKHKKERILERK